MSFLVIQQMSLIEMCMNINVESLCNIEGALGGSDKAVLVTKGGLMSPAFVSTERKKL